MFRNIKYSYKNKNTSEIKIKINAYNILANWYIVVVTYLLLNYF
jgi:hypothetical protein